MAFLATSAPLAFIFESVGGPEVLIILVVILILFGSKNLPKMARNIGRSVEEFRRAARDVSSEIMRADADETPKAIPPADLTETDPGYTPPSGSEYACDGYGNPPEPTPPEQPTEPYQPGGPADAAPAPSADAPPAESAAETTAAPESAPAPATAPESATAPVESAPEAADPNEPPRDGSQV
jgi:sec-independent protein translocase protein TatA